MSAPATSGLITIGNGVEATAVSISYDPTFYQRVAQIATQVAIAVVRENDSASIDNHTTRAGRAIQWFATCSAVASQIELAMLVAADNATTKTSTSQQIADRITAIWNTTCGI